MKTLSSAKVNKKIEAYVLQKNKCFPTKSRNRIVTVKIIPLLTFKFWRILWHLSPSNFEITNNLKKRTAKHSFRLITFSLEIAHYYIIIIVIITTKIKLHFNLWSIKTTQKSICFLLISSFKKSFFRIKMSLDNLQIISYCNFSKTFPKFSTQ